MYSKILVPLDGSAQSEQAVVAAGQIARATGGSVVLTQVLNAAGELLPYVVPGFEPSTLGADLQGATNYLTALTALPDLQGISVETEAVSGLVPSAILQLAQAKGVDLIVLTHGPRTTVRQWALGSVALKVAHHAAVPVLLLPEGQAGVPPQKAAPTGGLRVLVPLDGSHTAEAALLPAAMFVTSLSGVDSGHVHLLHVFDATDREGKVPESARTWAEQYLAQSAEQVRAAFPHPPEVTTMAIEGQDVAATINGVATGAAGPVDLIAIATRGRGGFQPWVGSVADRIIRGTSLPLLVTHPQQG